MAGLVGINALRRIDHVDWTGFGSQDVADGNI
jgi:hypothetical protein